MSVSTTIVPSIDERQQKETFQINEKDRRSSHISVEDNILFSKDAQRRIIRKVDIRLIGTLGVINCIALVDRLNLSNASIAGMTKDLELDVGNRYVGLSLVILLFFVMYVICEAPMAVLCRKIGPRLFLAGIVPLTWGLLMIGFAFAQKWTTLLPLRLLLGFCEGGFYPGSVYLISTWYTRYEVQKRYTIFYAIGIIASAFSGILAYGLMQMDGLGGLAGWRWIFIIEGIITFVVGCIGYFTLVPFPDQVLRSRRPFLKAAEIKFMIDRIDEDRADVTVEPFTIKRWISSGKDVKIWAYGLITLCGTTVSYAIAYFLPIILRNNMGFSVAKAQCLVAPPYAFAAVFMYGSAWAGDRYHVRGPILIVISVFGMIGLPLMAFPKNTGVQYLGVFLVTGASCAMLPTSWAYQSNNVRGQWNRAFASAVQIGLGAVGGITGALVFSPGYLAGIYATMACNGLIILIVATLTIYFKRENKMADTEGKVLEGSLDFRYTI